MHRKAYKPKDDVEISIKKICQNVLGDELNDEKFLNLNLEDRNLRFHVIIVI